MIENTPEVLVPSKLSRYANGEPVMVQSDDSDEPITAEWWKEHCGILSKGFYEIWLDVDGIVYIGSADELETDDAIVNVKTRGDIRDLCRLLGVELR